MNREAALQTLNDAEPLRRDMRAHARWPASGVAGLVLAVVLPAVAIAAGGGRIPLPFLVLVTTVPIVLNLYAYHQPVRLPGRLAAHYALTGTGVAMLTGTVVFGLALFPASTPWWVGGALLSALPLLASVALNRIGVRGRALRHTAHPGGALDEALLPTDRFALAAALSGVDRAGTGALANTLGTDASALSEPIRALREEGYLTVVTRERGTRSGPHVALTASGREAFDAHASALRRTAEGAPAPV
ncbi:MULTISPECIES: transcriptional regulator [unclassified Nocardiopsis]|uniref:transcriptional regulator n=1 Tax=unclassified Nocardiopsis TaxID=2649073 RepID=UPI0033E5CEAF